MQTFDIIVYFFYGVYVPVDKMRQTKSWIKLHGLFLLCVVCCVHTSLEHKIFNIITKAPWKRVNYIAALTDVQKEVELKCFSLCTFVCDRNQLATLNLLFLFVVVVVDTITRKKLRNFHTTNYLRVNDRVNVEVVCMYRTSSFPLFNRMEQKKCSHTHTVTKKWKPPKWNSK